MGILDIFKKNFNKCKQFLIRKSLSKNLEISKFLIYFSCNSIDKRRKNFYARSHCFRGSS